MLQQSASDSETTHRRVAPTEHGGPHAGASSGPGTTRMLPYHLTAYVMSQTAAGSSSAASDAASSAEADAAMSQAAMGGTTQTGAPPPPPGMSFADLRIAFLYAEFWMGYVRKAARFE